MAAEDKPMVKVTGGAKWKGPTYYLNIEESPREIELKATPVPPSSTPRGQSLELGPPSPEDVGRPVIKVGDIAAYYPGPEESLSEEVLWARPLFTAHYQYTELGRHTMAFGGQGSHLPPPPGPYVVPELKASCDWMMPTQDTDIDDSGGRPSWADTFVQVAFTVAQRGTCPARRVGCVITSADNHILATGYNGAPAGLPHCTQVGCSPDRDGRCTRAVHAEMNAVLQAAYIGVSIKGGVLYCTARPCLNCAKAIIQVGISRVVWAIDDTESRSRTEILGLLSRAGVDFSQYVPRGGGD